MPRDLLKRFPRAYRLQYAQPISDGSLLLTLELKSSEDDAFSLRRQELVRLSSVKKDCWTLRIQASIGRPAVGQDFIYLIHGPTGIDLFGNEYKRLSFQKISLHDGSILIDVDVPPANDAVHGYFRTINSDNKSLVLSHDEKFAMWIDNCCGRYILCTTTGKLMHSFASRVRRPNDATVPSAIHPGGFWDIRFPCSQLIAYDEENQSFNTSDLTLPEDAPTLGFDGDLDLFYHVIHDRPLPNLKFTNFYYSGKGRSMDRYARLGISSAVTKRKRRNLWSHSTSINRMPLLSDCLRPSKSSIGITLPGREQGEGRRDLVLKMPWKLCANDYFGIVQGYLVFHNPNDGVLVLVDFWPSW